MESITIIQRILPHYRVAFFRLLHATLRDKGVDMRLVYGQELPGTVPVTTDLREPWSRRIHNRYVRLGRSEIVWQPCLDSCRGSSLIVVEDSSRFLLNYALVFLKPLLGADPRIAFWGHGKNMQAGGRPSLPERLKRRMIGRADWWFAYTDLSAKVIADSGYPRRRITTVQNTMDAAQFERELVEVDEAEIAAVRSRYGIAGARIGLYCGGMYGHKNLPFLLEACLAIKAAVPDFTAVFIGDGPDRRFVSEAAGRHPWIHDVGPRFGREKAAFFRMSSAMLMPGLVGLAIVDSFVAAVPLFTTDIPIHSPEIAYLASGRNGVMTAPNVQDFAAAVVDFLLDPGAQATIGAGCRRSAAKFSLANMVENFSAGVLECLHGRNVSGSVA